jgi:hypothetical protein
MAKEAKAPRASAFVITQKSTGAFLKLEPAGAWGWTHQVDQALQFVRDVDASTIAARFIVQGYVVKERQL